MITPTLGRVVWFTPGKDSATTRMSTDADGRCAAIVTKVWHPGMVNLVVFDADGNVHGKTSVHLVQEGEPKPSGYFCEWMPYQLGQAAKTEAAEKAAVK